MVRPMPRTATTTSGTLPLLHLPGPLRGNDLAVRFVSNHWLYLLPPDVSEQQFPGSTHQEEEQAEGNDEYTPLQPKFWPRTWIEIASIGYRPQFAARGRLFARYLARTQACRAHPQTL